MSEGQWPSAVVAVAIMALVGGITISAIFHYNSVDDALKFWAGLTGLVGVITGAFVSYFFTRQTADAARQTAETAKQGLQAVQERAQASEQQAQTAQADAEAARQAQAAAQEKALGTSQALTAAMSLIKDPDLLADLRQEPAVREAMAPPSA